MKHHNQHTCNHNKPVGKYLLAFYILMLLLGGAYLTQTNKGIISPYVAQAQFVGKTKLVSASGSALLVKAQAQTAGQITQPLTREEKLQAFLEEKNSPLAPHSAYIVKLADKHDISWTLVASIAGKESTFGRNIKPNTYNAWGIMAWDSNDKRHIRTFKSWEQGIEFATQLISNSYRTNMNKAIQEKYCPSFECSDSWVSDVTSFQVDINPEI